MSGVIEETTYKAFKMRGEVFRDHVPYGQPTNKAVSSRMNYAGFYIKNRRIIEKEQAK